MDSYSYSSLFVGATVFLYLYRLRRKREANPRHLPLPPGPKGYPIIGSLFDAPVQKAWVTYDKWLKEYGDMVYFEVLGKPFLVLGSFKRTTDLFDKRSSKYSGRSEMAIFKLMGWDYNLAMSSYGDWWRLQRRAFHQHFHSNKVQAYEGAQVKGTRGLLRRLLKNPENFWRDARHQFGATIMDVSYGIIVQEDNDPYIILAEENLKGFTANKVLGNGLIHMFPFKYIPSWFPGGGWKKEVKHYAALSHELLNKPYNYAREQVKAGTARPSIASILIDGLREDESNFHSSVDETIAKNTAAVSYIAGSESTVTTVYSFFLAMCLHPDVQKKAQAELDEVLDGRLPEFSDRPFLPYINAVVKETLRWRPVGPLGVPHTTTEPDEYEGYYIPKGTTVIGNTWSLFNDPETFPEPDRFMPERYLTEDHERNLELSNMTTAAFGYGRRICAGRHFSDASLFITIASVLSTFNISPPLDKDGKPMKVQPTYVEDFLLYPTPFEALIQPRSEKAAELVRNSDFLD